MYTRKTKYSVFIEELKRTDRCGEVILWSENINNTKPNLTFGEAVDTLELVKNQDFAMGCLMLYETQMDTGLKKSLISKITDPMTAFQLYIRLLTLTDEEDQMLIDIFKGKLPNAEAELKEGIVVRKKR